MEPFPEKSGIFASYKKEKMSNIFKGKTLHPRQAQQPRNYSLMTQHNSRSGRRPGYPPSMARNLPNVVNPPAIVVVHIPGLLLNIGPSWCNALHLEFKEDYFLQLCKFVDEEREFARLHPTDRVAIYPPAHEVFSWTQYCDISDVKVVILGQDPYPRPYEAHGLSFSDRFNLGIGLPVSLKNIYNELERDDDVEFVRPVHGNLTGWATQGVLMLNTVLTVRQGDSNSHARQTGWIGGWEEFTDAVIKRLSSNSKVRLVFMLWGVHAQEKGACIDTKKHLVLKAYHPAFSGNTPGQFFGCCHFSKANAYLTAAQAINWSQL